MYGLMNSMNSVVEIMIQFYSTPPEGACLAAVDTVYRTPVAILHNASQSTRNLVFGREKIGGTMCVCLWVFFKGLQINLILSHLLACVPFSYS